MAANQTFNKHTASRQQTLFLSVSWALFAIFFVASMRTPGASELVAVLVLAVVSLSFYFARWLFPQSPVPVIPNISVLFLAVVALGPLPDLMIILLTAPFLVLGMRHIWKTALFWPAEDALSTMFGYFAFHAFGGVVGRIAPSEWVSYLAFWVAYFISNTLLIPVYYKLGTSTSLKQLYKEQFLLPSAFAMNTIDLIFGFLMLFAMEDYGMFGVVFISVALWLVNVNYRALLRSFMQSQRDELTGLLNRRYFSTTLGKYLRHKKPFALLMLDLDNYKVYNDSQGHVSGDKLLQQVSQLLLTNAGDTAVVCRYGGEEFTIILPYADANEAFSVAERIRESVSTYIFSGMDAMPLGKITISIGISAYPELASTPEEVTEQADRALYQVKSQGKNQSLVYTRDPRTRQES